MRDPASDILRSATSIVEQFGDEAPGYCAWKIVDALQSGGSEATVKKWLAIRQEVKSLLDAEAPDVPPDGSRRGHPLHKDRTRPRNAKAPVPLRTPALTAGDAPPISPKEAGLTPPLPNLLGN
jgi:hypothetical protein